MMTRNSILKKFGSVMTATLLSVTIAGCGDCDDSPTAPGRGLITVTIYGKVKGNVLPRNTSFSMNVAADIKTDVKTVETLTFSGSVDPQLVYRASKDLAHDYDCFGKKQTRSSPDGASEDRLMASLKDGNSDLLRLEGSISVLGQKKVAGARDVVIERIESGNVLISATFDFDNPTPAEELKVRFSAAAALSLATMKAKGLSIRAVSDRSSSGKSDAEIFLAPSKAEAELAQ